MGGGEGEILWGPLRGPPSQLKSVNVQFRIWSDEETGGTWGVTSQVEVNILFSCILNLNMRWLTAGDVRTNQLQRFIRLITAPTLHFLAILNDAVSSLPRRGRSVDLFKTVWLIGCLSLVMGNDAPQALRKK